MKKLMILGGSRYALPVIEAAHKLGIYVITCDYLPDNIAHKYSDEYCNISIIDKEKTFGVLKFSALRREIHMQNEDGTVSEEIKERTYDLKCNTQGRMIQVSVPATIPLKDYDYNAEVELINPVADTVANANYRGADVDWYVKADDIVLKSKENHNIDSPQNRLPQGQPKK